MADEHSSCELNLSVVVGLDFAIHAGARVVADVPSPVKCQILRHTPRRRVLYVPGAPALLVKQYFHPGPIDLIKSFVRGTPALREWRALREAERRHLPVPKPLALGQRDRQSLIVTEFIEAAATLEDFAKAEPRSEEHTSELQS